MQFTDIGIDLGTASILVYIRGRGVVLKEPSVVAFDRDTDKIKAIGEDARLMLGRTPGHIIAVRPLRQGVISNYEVTEKMMKYFIQKAMGRKSFRKPRISVCVPSGVTEVEKKAVEDATMQAGAREVSIIEEPIAAGFGDVDSGANGSGNRLFYNRNFAGSGLHRCVFNGLFLYFGNAAWHTDGYARFAEALASHRFLDEIFHHLFRHFIIRDNALTERPDSDNIAGGPAKHQTRVFADGFDFIGIPVESHD
jgi:hypothetical protein